MYSFWIIRFNGSIIIKKFLDKGLILLLIILFEGCFGQSQPKAIACFMNDNDLYGFIDNAGKIIIQPQFSEVLYGKIIFKNGRAVVRKKIEDGSFRYGVIDCKGRIVIPFKYPIIIQKDDLFFVYNCNSSMNLKQMNNLTGLSFINEGFSVFDKYGNLTCSYGITPASQPSFTDEPKFFDFIKNRLCVEINNRFGAINRSGKLVIPTIYEMPFFFDFEKGIACVKKDNFYGSIDTLNHPIIDLKFKTMQQVEDTLLLMHILPSKNENLNLNTQLSTTYDFSPIQKSGVYGVIDANGKMIVPFKYKYIGQFAPLLIDTVVKKVGTSYKTKNNYQVQADFINKKIKEFESQINSGQTSDEIKQKQESLTKSFFNDGNTKVIEWAGQIISLDIFHDTELDIAITILPRKIAGQKTISGKTIDCGITIEADQASSKKYGYKGILRNGSLYEKVKMLKEGDKVIFSAIVVGTSDNTEKAGLNLSTLLHLKITDIRKQ